MWPGTLARHVVLPLDLISEGQHQTKSCHSVIIMKGGKQEQLIIFSKEDKDKITVWTTHSEDLPSPAPMSHCYISTSYSLSLALVSPPT